MPKELFPLVDKQLIQYVFEDVIVTEIRERTKAILIERLNQ